MKWPMVKLGDVCRVIPGFAFKSSEFANEGIPLVKIANISDDYTVDITGAQCWPRQHFSERLKKFVLKDKDIVVAMSGATAGKLGRVRTNVDLLLNQRVAKIEAINAEPDFIWVALSSKQYRERFFSIAGGAAQPNMSGGQIEGVDIPFPPIHTQQRIAEVLSAYDELMENNRRRMGLLEEAARQLYKEWFVRLRFPGHEHVKITNGLPEGWERRCVAELVKRIPAGKLFSQATAQKEGRVPILDQGRSGMIGYHDEEPSVDATEDVPVIVFANHTCHQRLILHPFSAIQNVLPFVSSDNCYRDIYWLHYATDGAVNINAYKGHWPELMAKEILVPAPRVSEMFGKFAKDHVLQIAVLERQNQKLRAARDLLLPRLMSGEIAV